MGIDINFVIKCSTCVLSGGLQSDMKGTLIDCNLISMRGGLAG